MLQLNMSIKTDKYQNCALFGWQSCRLHNQNYFVKGRIEKTTLGEVTEYLEEVFLPDDCFLLIKLDVERIKLLKLEVNADSIRYEILKAPKLKIKPKDCNVVSDSLITIRPGVSGKSSMYYHLQYLKERIGKIFFYLRLNVQSAPT